MCRYFNVRHAICKILYLSDGLTCLMIACRNKSPEITKIILHKDANNAIDLNVVDRYVIKEFYTHCTY